jgi:tRNA pseudouridine38-40 synthase
MPPKTPSPRMSQRPDSSGVARAEEQGSELVRIRLGLGYDGTDFFGWAKQPGLRTVQGVLEDSAMAMVEGFGSPGLTAITCAGRTDSGVHARRQTAHLDLPSALWGLRGSHGVVGQLTAQLPSDVRVLSAERVPHDFDARFSAVVRTYTYQLFDRTTHLEPLDLRFAAAVGVPLDVKRMAAGGRLLLGEHDFAAFCRRREGASTVRTLLRCEPIRGLGQQITVTVAADAFCHSMVRSLVGALVAVGQGKHELEWLSGLLLRESRSDAVLVMPAAGLVLESITYPPPSESGAQAERARRFRTRPC